MPKHAQFDADSKYAEKAAKKLIQKVKIQKLW
jgi:hypothetical protein